MASIGKPQTKNPFKGVQMAPKQRVSDNELSKGEYLNKLSGNSFEEQQFVDRKTHNKLGKDGFLKLLTHQLSNQDPMKPMDQKQFAADLAQFSQLEQLTNMNKGFEEMSKGKMEQMKFQGASFLGREVVTNGTTVNYDGKNIAVDLPFFLPKNAKNVLVRILDKQGQIVSQLSQENVNKGQNSLSWNGKTLDNVRAAQGTYTVQVLGWDENMEKFNGETKTVGKITGVNFEGNETVLTIDGKKVVSLRDVDSFKVTTHNVNKKNLEQTRNQASKAYAQTMEQ